MPLSSFLMALKNATMPPTIAFVPSWKEAANMAKVPSLGIIMFCSYIFCILQCTSKSLGQLGQTCKWRSFLCHHCIFLYLLCQICSLACKADSCSISGRKTGCVNHAMEFLSYKLHHNLTLNLLQRWTSTTGSGCSRTTSPLSSARTSTRTWTSSPNLGIARCAPESPCGGSSKRASTGIVDE